MIEIVTFSSLFPNRVNPTHGIFVEQRLKKLVSTGEVRSHVVAPVPWFPFKLPVFGAYAKLASVPERENRSGLEVAHPRYPVIPKIGMTVAPVMMAAAVRKTVRNICRRNPAVKLIDAHYLYPDGVAAILLGKWLNKPVVVTARGTDVNLIPNYTLPRKMIEWAGRHSAKIITVSDALRDRLVELGYDPEHVVTLRNGVDLDRFKPIVDRESLREKFKISGFTLLSVGHLIERKGHHVIIDALPLLQDVNLLVAGDGPMRSELEAQARRLGVTSQVRFLGSVSQETLIELYNCADILVLASSREGMANVLLESIACGTPVLATPIWGNPEVVAAPSAGCLLAGRSAEAIVEGVRTVSENLPSRQEVRNYATTFSWDSTTKGQLSVFEEVSQASLFGPASKNMRTGSAKRG